MAGACVSNARSVYLYMSCSMANDYGMVRRWKLVGGVVEKEDIFLVSLLIEVNLEVGDTISLNLLRSLSLLSVLATPLNNKSAILKEKNNIFE